jgi:DNA-directed RNA polymerase subunit RPC12/RpoP
MTGNMLKKCPRCGQQLRFPEDIGGMLMACPSCGNKFQSDFRLNVARKSANRSLLMTIFEMPDKLVRRMGRFLFPNLYPRNENDE